MSICCICGSGDTAGFYDYRLDGSYISQDIECCLCRGHICWGCITRCLYCNRWYCVDHWPRECDYHGVDLLQPDESKQECKEE